MSYLRLNASRTINDTTAVIKSREYRFKKPCVAQDMIEVIVDAMKKSTMNAAFAKIINAIIANASMMPKTRGMPKSTRVVKVNSVMPNRKPTTAVP